MYCSHCGKQVPENTKFCPYCGADLRAAQPTRPATQPVKKASWQSYLAWAQSRRGLVLIVAALIIIVLGGAIYHHQSFKAQVARYDSWYLVTKDGLSGQTTGDGVIRLAFRKNGRMAVNEDEGAPSLPEAVGARLKDYGSWQGDHQKVMATVTENGATLKITFTKQQKFKRVIKGYPYKGYAVRVDLAGDGDHESTNAYLLHR